MLASRPFFMRTAVFSIVSPNYRHYARVLMDSVSRHHPEWDRFVLIVGETAPSREREAFTTIDLDALQLPHAAQFCFRYTLLELNTAVKPWMFAHLFARGYDRVVYLDPDIFVFAPLAELDDSFLTLTPHLTGFLDRRKKTLGHPTERTILQAGTYNLGFLAVTRSESLDDFLGWWKEKLEFDCVVDVARGVFVDQKWMDLTTGFFPGVRILRHDGYNVAYWNLRQRRVVVDGDDITVNGQPLRFFHFSGVDPTARWLVSKHDNLRMSEVGDARIVIERYHETLRGEGHASIANAPYAFAFFHDGTPLPDSARIAYRNSPHLQSAAGEDPFDHPELFTEMVAAAPPPVHIVTPRRRRFADFAGRSYQVLSRARPIVLLFPKPVRRAAREFLLGRKDPESMHAAPSVLPDGVNIVGYLSRPTGIGESARLCKVACDVRGVRTHLIDVDAHADRTQTPIYPVSIHHVNADQSPIVRTQLSNVFEGSARNVGVWHWELPELPDEWIASADVFDEIWAPSAFIQSAVSRKVTKPVVHMPHGIAIREMESCSPEELGVARGQFVFLCMFDLGSVAVRKNPMGAIDAFHRAFPSTSNATLLIKAGHADDHPRDYEELADHVRGMANVVITDRMLSRPRVNGLIDASDAIVSLHRSEGFGLILAEAMALGKPVIATAWSGNMDFMNGGNSCPVNYSLVTLDRDHGTYRAGQQWAEPDTEHAAQLMRRVVNDDAYRAQIRDHARATIQDEFSPMVAGDRIHRRLAFLRAGLTP